MTEEEKNAIEYLKARLYGNEDCEYIDIAQEDLRVFINLIDRREKEIGSWKNYSEELEKEKLEISNKECELEFDIEKLQKELKQKDKIIDLIAEAINNHDIDQDTCKQMGQKANCNEFKDTEKCKECIKQYFQSKANGGKN